MELKRKMSAGSVDMNTGKLIRFTEEIGSFDYIMYASRASASVPVFFPSVRYDTKVLNDGGLVQNLDLSAAVNRCWEIVEDPKDIIIDVVLCSGADIEEVDASDYNSLQIGWRAYQISKYWKTMGYIERAKLNFPEVNL